MLFKLQYHNLNILYKTNICIILLSRGFIFLLKFIILYLWGHNFEMYPQIHFML
jgi:hypothetical protein